MTRKLTWGKARRAGFTSLSTSRFLYDKKSKHQQKRKAFPSLHKAKPTRALEKSSTPSCGQPLTWGSRRDLQGSAKPGPEFLLLNFKATYMKSLRDFRYQCAEQERNWPEEGPMVQRFACGDEWEMTN